MVSARQHDRRCLCCRCNDGAGVADTGKFDDRPTFSGHAAPVLALADAGVAEMPNRSLKLARKTWGSEKRGSVVSEEARVLWRQERPER